MIIAKGAREAPEESSLLEQPAVETQEGAPWIGICVFHHHHIFFIIIYFSLPLPSYLFIIIIIIISFSLPLQSYLFIIIIIISFHHRHHHHIFFIIIQGGPLACQRCLLSLDQITTGSRKILISPNNETSRLCCVLMLMVGWSVKQIKYVLTKTCLKRADQKLFALSSETFLLGENGKISEQICFLCGVGRVIGEQIPAETTSADSNL